MRPATQQELRAVRAGRLTRETHCERKHSFSQERAIRLAQRKSDETGLKITAYPCLFCDGWHIGKAGR